MKTCTNKDCDESDPEEFHKIADTGRRHTQCRKCLTRKAGAREKKKPKKRVVGKMDGGMANDYTMMRW